MNEPTPTPRLHAIVLLLFFCGCVSEAERLRPYERAYFEGQRDAIEGDVRIEKRDGVWSWKKTCWDTGTPTSFDPSCQ
jgi:hypothetical protein